MKLIFLLLTLQAGLWAHADFSSTMRAFGRQMVTADLLGTRREPTHEDIAQALSGLEDAIRGATLLIEANCENGLLPAKVSRLETPEARRTYSTRFIKLMEAFRRRLIEYRDLIAAPALDQEALSQKRTQIRAIAQSAHQHL